MFNSGVILGGEFRSWSLLGVNIRMRIFQAVLYTYLSVLARRISLTIKRFLVCGHFCYSRDLFVGFKGDVVGRW